MEVAAAQRRYAALHDKLPYHDGTFANWSAKATADAPYHYLDGVTIYVADTDLAPNDDFLSAPEG